VAAIIYLSGVVRSELVGLRSDLGVMLTPMMGNLPDLSAGPWAADNARFAQPDRFTMEGFLAWLEVRVHAAATCLFATAPEVLADPRATWELSRDALPLIRARGFRAALVAQDGMRPGDVDPDSFDVLFLGGRPAEVEWKLSHHARDLTLWARAHGKAVHMGRVNSLKRLRIATRWGCASADGTFLRAAPDQNVPRLLRWLDDLHQSPVLTYGAAA
jgi:hypothetical protein